jgi:hypothetical protein
MKRKEIEHELVQKTQLDELLTHQHYESILAEFRCLEVACLWSTPNLAVWSCTMG